MADSSQAAVGPDVALRTLFLDLFGARAAVRVALAGNPVVCDRLEARIEVERVKLEGCEPTHRMNPASPPQDG